MSDYHILKEKGFFCYCSNREGDLFRSNKPQFKGLKIIGSYKGFTFNDLNGLYYENITIKELCSVLGLA